MSVIRAHAAAGLLKMADLRLYTMSRIVVLSFMTNVIRFSINHFRLLIFAHQSFIHLSARSAQTESSYKAPVS